MEKSEVESEKYDYNHGYGHAAHPDLHMKLASKGYTQ